MARVLDKVGNAAMVFVTVIKLAKPVKRRNTRLAYRVDKQRRRVNRATEEAARRKWNQHRSVPAEMYDEINRLYKMQTEIEVLVISKTNEKILTEESALRARAVALLYQLRLKIRNAELLNYDLALSLQKNGPPGLYGQDAVRLSESDLTSARRLCRELRLNLLGRLGSGEIQRERLARRLLGIFRLRFSEAFDRDLGIVDLRQELGGLENQIDDHQETLSGAGGEYFTQSLGRLVGQEASFTDAELVGQMVEMIERVVQGNYEPMDYVYPVLIFRSWAIIAAFDELPTNEWTLLWRACCAGVHGWLYLFAADAAQDEGHPDAADQYRRQAGKAARESRRLLEGAIAQRQLVKSLTTWLSTYGRPARLVGFGTPPSVKRLIAMTDELTGRLFGERKSS